MMTLCRFYLDDQRKHTTKFNLDLVEKDWRRGNFVIGERLSFAVNAGVWSYRTDHSLTVVTTEGHVLYWRAL